MHQKPLQMRHAAPAANDAEIEAVSGVGQRDVEGLAVKGDRHRVVAIEFGATPEEPITCSRDVGDDEIERRRRRRPQHRKKFHHHRRDVERRQRHLLNLRQRPEHLLVVVHRGVDRPQALPCVRQIGAEIGEQRSHLVAAGGFALAEVHRNHRDQRLVRQGILLEQICAQCTATHREHHIVEGDAGGLLDRQEALDRPGLRRTPPRAGDGHVEHGLRRSERQRQLLLENPLAREVIGAGAKGRKGFGSLLHRVEQ